MAEWIISDTPQNYRDSVLFMEQRIADIRSANKNECVWLLEHPPLYTGGTSAKNDDLLNPQFPVYETGRGGQYTYHGPGQRVAYVMLDLKKRQTEPDLKKYIWQLEEWIIQSLKEFDIHGERREERVGIWIPGEQEKKIAAIGVRVRHWVTYHGISINLNPDLSHFEGIVPCGISEHGVTSIHDLGREDVTMRELDESLAYNFERVFHSSLQQEALAGL